MGTADEVLKLLATTPFAAHFAQEHVQAVVKTIIGQHTADSINIERGWHHDRLVAAEGA